MNNSKQLRITDWPEDERPRERLMQKGAEALTNAELTAILLGQGTAKHNAVELARKLIHHFKTLKALSEASLPELQKIDGIGPAKAITLLASFQLYRNMEREAVESTQVAFKKAETIWKIYKDILGRKTQESFWIVLLSNSLHKITDFEVSKGILDKSLVHPREVFREAIRYNAKGLILMHNHPSGQTNPSKQDLDITKRLVESAHILGLNIYDHLIITESGYYSFAENNQI
jgi:DNA repair protein RadC